MVALEVLDNLPHDKIKSCPVTGDLLQAEIYSAENSMNTKELTEVFVPLSDGLIKEVLALQPSYSQNQNGINRTTWVPTVACGILREIIQTRPSSSILLADFDWLPPPQLVTESIKTRISALASNEPLVTCMNDNDHLCYLNAPPFCDILFPTDFSSLLGFLGQCKNEQNKVSTIGNVMKQSEFLSRFGATEVEETRSKFTGFTPLLEDFTNCSVLVSTNCKK